MIKLYKNDCLIEMKNISDKSIDLILCDLPYEIVFDDKDEAIYLKTISSYCSRKGEQITK